jgi:hypothetical protein
MCYTYVLHVLIHMCLLDATLQARSVLAELSYEEAKHALPKGNNHLQRIFVFTKELELEAETADRQSEQEILIHIGISLFTQELRDRSSEAKRLDCQIVLSPKP